MAEIKSRIMELMKKISDLRIKLIGMVSSERDQKAIILGIAIFSVLVLYLIFHSINSGTSNLSKEVEQLQVQLVDVNDLRSEYLDSKKKISIIASRIKKEDEALISVVEKILVAQNIERKNFSIRDTNSRTPGSEDLFDENSVNVDVKRVSLKNFVDVLYDIQAKSSFLKVSDLRIRTKFDNPDLMDVTMRISTFDFKKVI